MKKTLIALLSAVVVFASCKKDEDKKNEESSNPEQVKKEVISDLASNVIVATYADMNDKAQQLLTSVQSFKTTGSEADFKTSQDAWYAVRNAWEKSEGFLFGPVASANIDPRIDTWPVNYQSLDSVLNSNATYNSAYIETLEDALRGFHPIEYLLFGQNKSKKASEFTDRQKEYLVALTENLKGLCTQALNEWNNGYFNSFTTPVAGAEYETQRAVYEELVNAIAGICDEVANGKIKEPFVALDPSLEESPFALNSIKDFTNNMHSVENIYYGKYNGDGKGLEDFVKLYNLSLNNQIGAEIQAAIQSLNNITVPFGQAITTQSTQVQNAMTAINKLKATLEGDLMQLVVAQTK